ncbi:TPA: hypothetical protein NGU10_002906 [Vibrio parahaemolyticus]|uniref:hypothetical protein n=1 Tax=Vibrio parahaemolyticus TaxID=670 RepID=UPI0008FC4E35|nr:hypothetical protein [Vibrio parahaemolyticus]APC89883.1 hypothetical protein FORC22_4022 [Vibrio parahaemolyticus]HCE2430464.1 hypothetical protein [Vibrio parahaemolyticus]HCE2487901.1 hypothetical protein [Vibrio parahaemolyticus]
MQQEEKARDRELSNGILRQRRNLLISSVAVFIFLALGFEITEIKFLGNSAKVNNPLAVPVLILMAHLYFTLRYWQYYLEENPIPKVRDVIKQSIVDYESSYLSGLTKQKVEKLFSFESIYPSFPRNNLLTWGKPREQIPDKVVGINTKAVCVYLKIHSVDEILNVCDMVDNNFVFKPQYANQNDWIIAENIEDNWGTKKVGIVLEGWVTCRRTLFFWFRVKSVFKYIFKQSYFTDYQLPLVLSFLSLCFALLAYLGNVNIPSLFF